MHKITKQGCICMLTHVLARFASFLYTFQVIVPFSISRVCQDVETRPLSAKWSLLDGVYNLEQMTVLF